MLRRYRIGANLTQEELAERAGLSARGLRDLERGERSLPHRDTAQRLAAALARVRLSELHCWRADHRGRRRGANYPSRWARSRSTSRPGRCCQSRRPASWGRERELAELQTILAHKRLLTLTGVGGVGKTRLALELARRSVADDLGDVALIDLAPLLVKRGSSNSPTESLKA